jgi:hypothetical protein
MSLLLGYYFTRMSECAGFALLQSAYGQVLYFPQIYRGLYIWYLL